MKSIILSKITRGVVPILGLLLLMPTSLIAQDKSTNTDLLIGTWALDYDQTISQIDRSSKLHYDTISQARKTHLRNSFSQRKTTFQTDGTYILEVKAGHKVAGTWQLLEDNETIRISLEGRTIEQRIERISQSSMLLNLGGSQTADRLFRRWHLNKVRG